MSRSRRAALALSLLALTAAAVPAGANGGYVGGGYVDANVYLMSVSVPGGRAWVETVVVRYHGAEADADTGGLPSAGPDIGQEAYACVYLVRGKTEDMGCDDIDPAGVSRETDMSRGTLKFSVPSYRYKGGKLNVDVALAATGEAEPYPGYQVSTYGPFGPETEASVAVVNARPVEATGSVTGPKGGGKVSATSFGLLLQEHWVGGYTYAY